MLCVHVARGAGAGRPDALHAPTHHMHVLELRGVFKRYRAGIPGCSAAIDALRGIDLFVRSGEIVGIAGPPGAGKTTLLLCAAGLLRPDAGTVSWFGASSIRPCRPAGTAYVTAGGVPYRFMTVREVLENHAILNRLEPATSASLVDGAIGTTGLAGLAAARVAELALGAMRRLALAQALLGAPRLWLIDDLHPDPDPGEAAVLSSILAALVAGGSTVLYASRDADAVAQVATRMLALSLGRIRGDVDPARGRNLHRVAERPH